MSGSEQPQSTEHQSTRAGPVSGSEAHRSTQTAGSSLRVNADRRGLGLVVVVWVISAQSESGSDSELAGTEQRGSHSEAESRQTSWLGGGGGGCDSAGVSLGEDLRCATFPRMPFSR